VTSPQSLAADKRRASRQAAAFPALPAPAPWTGWPPVTRWLVAAGLAASLALLFAHASVYWFLTDDGFISFRYADNLSHGFGLVFNPGFERVEGYSNFLWVVLLAALDRIGLVPEQSAQALSVIATVALWGTVAWWAARGAVRHAWVVLVPVLFLAATRSVAVWSSGGLETRWFEALIVAGALRLVVETEARLRRGHPCALAPWLFALACLTRPDGMLLAVAAFVASSLVLHRRRRLEPARVLRDWLPCLLLVGGQFLFRRLYYDAWLPNTYFAKVDGRTWWGPGLRYLAAFALEYAAWLWIPLLAAAVAAHRDRRTLFVPALFACLIVPHALYIASIGGDHFEYRPLDLYFPIVFLLMADGLRHVLERPRLRAPALALTALVLAGLWAIPWASHRQFPTVYHSGFPGREDTPESRAWLAPGNDPVQHLPLLRSIAATHRRLLGELSANYVGLRAEEHRLFLATVVPDAMRLRALVDRGLLPRDLHMAMGCVGAIPYYSRVRTLDLLGLTDATVAHQPFRERHSMGHDKLASDAYVKARGVDVWALAGIHPFLAADSDRLTGMVMNAVVQQAEWYAADVGAREYLVCTFPQGAARARARMPGLRFERLPDSSFARPVLRRAEAAYVDSLRRDPANVQDRMVLADLRLFLDEPGGAAEQYERVLAAGVESVQLRLNLARAYERDGRPQRAIRSLERALLMARSTGDSALAAALEARLARARGAPRP
jgi:arabinofuranosyltransferase